MKKRITVLFLFFSLFSLAIASCGTASLDITDVWGRPGQVGGNTAAYFKIKNASLTQDRLLSASADISRAVELHMSMMSGEGEGQMMQMKPQEFVEIKGLKTTEFKPGGLHVMFIDLNTDLTLGDSYQLILKFEKAGEIQLEVPVREP